MSFEPSISSNPPASRDSRSRSNGKAPPGNRERAPLNPAFNPWALSAAAHAAVAAAVVAMLAVRPPRRETIEFEVIHDPVVESPAVAPPSMDLAPKDSAPGERPPRPEPASRPVFGVSPRAWRDVPSEPAEPGAKTGNTVATTPSDETLQDGDPDALPLPTDEYLVSEMPSLLAEVRIPYPQEARAAGVEGRVTLDVLIDASGAVRDARLVSGPGHGLNEAALAAVRRFQFKPAKVGAQAVAVRTRFIYNFVLER